MIIRNHDGDTAELSRSPRAITVRAPRIIATRARRTPWTLIWWSLAMLAGGVLLGFAFTAKGMQ